MKSRTDFLTEEGYLNYLRVHFSAMAMAGICNNMRYNPQNEKDYMIAARGAVSQAEALITVLN